MGPFDEVFARRLRRLPPAWLGPDVRLAVRALRRSPGFSATAASILALAIGGATALFGVVDAVLLRPLPYPSPEDRSRRCTCRTSTARGAT